jgi:drug/metabolite transporter (DMT)-like permease
MAAARTMSATEWALLAVLSVLWGGSFLFVAVAVAELPPLTLVLARVALAALALQLVAVVTGQPAPGDPGPLAGLRRHGPPQQRHPV